MANASSNLALRYSFCSSDREFAWRFPQIIFGVPPRDGHSCMWLTFPTVMACSERASLKLSPMPILGAQQKGPDGINRAFIIFSHQRLLFYFQIARLKVLKQECPFIGLLRDNHLSRFARSMSCFSINSDKHWVRALMILL